MSYKTCPEWPELMELAPDLQFKHISVADAPLPFDVLSKIPHVSLGEVVVLRASSANTTQLASATTCDVFDEFGGFLQKVGIHTSCSQPLDLGALARDEDVSRYIL